MSDATPHLSSPGRPRPSHVAAMARLWPARLGRARLRVTLRHFWWRISDDWIFDLAGLLAFNFLLATFPVLIVLFAIAGLVLGLLSPGTYHELTANVELVVPQGGTAIVKAAGLLARAATPLLALAIGGSVYAGSRLFVVIENCFGIIYRVRGRALWRQNAVAIAMFLLYAVIIPLVALASFLPTAIVSTYGLNARADWTALKVQIAGIFISAVSAAVLFAVMYLVMPNRPLRRGHVWRGTLLAAALLFVYQLIFPIYESLLLRPNRLGSIVGFLLVILSFFYYLGLILLLGAELNSIHSGQRRSVGNLTTILHQVQAHATTRGAAGPTAGTRSEDIEHHEGAPAMRTRARALFHLERQHAHDAHPPPEVAWRPPPSAPSAPPAAAAPDTESPGPGADTAAPRAEHPGQTDEIAPPPSA